MHPASLNPRPGLLRCGLDRKVSENLPTQQEQRRNMEEIKKESVQPCAIRRILVILHSFPKNNFFGVCKTEYYETD